MRCALVVLLLAVAVRAADAHPNNPLAIQITALGEVRVTPGQSGAF